ncbi:Glycerophosphoryl diester phosphodiesterase family-domain-containing protein [Xylaria venustula]|nr:Glycerophosphoryl diester phosphodiesterase family-domain-containing protein [Xylaria venustula]
MRFGLDYHRRFVPEWSEFYIQYDLIKSRLKSGIHAVDHTAQLLAHDVEAFVAFHSDQLCALQRRETFLWNIFDNSQDYQLFHPRERNFLLGELDAVLQELLKLQWFDRVNQEAIDRLLNKFNHATLQSEPSQLVESLRTQWYQQKQAQRLELSNTREKLQSSISRVGESIEPNESAHSALLPFALETSPRTPLIPDSLFRALDGTIPDASEDLFTQLTASSETFSPKIAQGLFIFFVIHRSWRNVLMLLEHSAPRRILNLGHNHIQLLITVHAQEIHSSDADLTDKSDSHLDISDGSSSSLVVFARVLQLLVPTSVAQLLTKGADEPPIFHLLAKYGLLEWCRLALERLQETEGKSNITFTILSTDRLKLTPLHYALIHHHPSVVDFLSKRLLEDSEGHKSPDCQAILGNYLTLAVEFGRNDIVASISRIVDPNFKSIYGSSPLHIASRDGRVDIITLLLQAGAKVDLSEHPRQWTPLFEAAVNDRVEAVQYLIENGSNAALTDCLGWTAKELATYRGHLAVAELLDGVSTGGYTQSIKHTSHATNHIAEHGSTKPGDIIVSVNLGPMQVGRDLPPVQLKYFSANSMGGNESLFYLKISAAGQAHRIQLPIMDDRSNVPLVFVFPQGADLQLAFKVFRDDPERGELVCGGTALLESNTLLFGTSRQSLIREHTVSVLDSTTLDIAGSILFTCVVAKPYTHLKSSKYSLAGLNNSGSSVPLVGHRGLGANVTNRQHLQIGENTVESFVAAANAGASFVEDIQLTKDLEPVIYHNFSLSETGTDVPINDITIDQYRCASRAQEFQSVLDADKEEAIVKSCHAKTRPRSLSLGYKENSGALQIVDQLKHTVDFKSKGMKANTRGHVIQQPLATLKDIFHKLPETVGFNIEFKYPRFHETAAANVAPIGPELNLYVDTILEHVYLYGGDRPIILSSFTPEICILLSLKQKAYPVMFITNAGKLPMIDVEKRAANMQVAIKFAKLWNLTGIVFASEPLVLCPRLIRHVKSFGLACASYGPQNSVPDRAIAQVQAGIDILIVDKVGLIAKTLKEVTR